MNNPKPWRDRSIKSFSENAALARVQFLFRVLVIMVVMPLILFWRALVESVWPNLMGAWEDISEFGYIWRELGKPKYKKEI